MNNGLMAMNGIVGTGMNMYAFGKDPNAYMAAHPQPQQPMYGQQPMYQQPNPNPYVVPPQGQMQNNQYNQPMNQQPMTAPPVDNTVPPTDGQS